MHPSPSHALNITFTLLSLLSSLPGVVQLLFQVEPNPFPFNYVANYTVSTEVASMEFRTENGTQIPIANLDESQAITVAVNNGSGGGGGGGGAGAGGGGGRDGADPI